MLIADAQQKGETVYNLLLDFVTVRTEQMLGDGVRNTLWGLMASKYTWVRGVSF